MNIHSDILKQKPELVQLDPVLARAQQLKALWDMQPQVIRANDPSASRVISHHMEAIEKSIEAEKARTVPGALAQIALASSTVDLMESTVQCYLENPDDPVCQNELSSVIQYYHTVNRLLYSVADVLRANAAGIDLLSEDYMAPELSPWAVEDRLQQKNSEAE